MGYPGLRTLAHDFQCLILRPRCGMDQIGLKLATEVSFDLEVGLKLES